GIEVPADGAIPRDTGYDRTPHQTIAHRQLVFAQMLSSAAQNSGLRRRAELAYCRLTYSRLPDDRAAARNSFSGQFSDYQSLLSRYFRAGGFTVPARVLSRRHLHLTCHCCKQRDYTQNHGTTPWKALY